MTKTQIPEQLRQLLINDSKLFNSPVHGLKHWTQVHKNGLYLSRYCDADVEVVTYFAYLHDCMRQNEWGDPRHGRRGAEYAESIREHIHLNDEQFAVLWQACSGHTRGRESQNATVSVCWDSDRLDLGRVGITPQARLLFTEEAKRIANTFNYGVLGLSYPE